MRKALWASLYAFSIGRHARALSALGIASVATAATPAPAGAETASGGSTPATTTTAPAGTGGATIEAPPPPVHRAPITSRNPSLHYSGPVYELSSTGQVVPYVAPTLANSANLTTGGSVATAITTGKPKLLVPGRTARLIGGLAAAPLQAPQSVRLMIWAANRIVGLPYIYGGGHASFRSPGYDCSGTVSFALHGAAMLATPEDSSELEGYGGHGIGEWVTIFANPGHAYMAVAGLRLDTSPVEDPSDLRAPAGARCAPRTRASSSVTRTVSRRRRPAAGRLG